MMPKSYDFIEETMFGQSIFKNEPSLFPEYVPPELPCRGTRSGTIIRSGPEMGDRRLERAQSLLRPGIDRALTGPGRGETGQPLWVCPFAPRPGRDILNGLQNTALSPCLEPRDTPLGGLHGQGRCPATAPVRPDSEAQVPRR